MIGYPMTAEALDQIRKFVDRDMEVACDDATGVLIVNVKDGKWMLQRSDRGMYTI